MTNRVKLPRGWLGDKIKARLKKGSSKAKLRVIASQLNAYRSKLAKT